MADGKLRFFDGVFDGLEEGIEIGFSVGSADDPLRGC